MKQSTRRLRGAEILESRRCLTAPTIGQLVISPGVPDLGEPLMLTVTEVNDPEQDVQEVRFFVDDGDQVWGANDALVGVDRDGTDGWGLRLPTSSPYRLLPLGDSITQPEGGLQSYRYPLWQNLHDEGYAFDFVGTQNRNAHGSEALWPDYQGHTFDRDHEGHYGWRTDQVLAELPAWLNQYAADVVLMHLGTNDVFQSQDHEQTISELGAVISTLRQHNPHVAVLVSQLLPNTFASNADVADLNALLPAAVATWHSNQSPVLLVDQHTPFDAERQTVDGVHPNPAGEEQMADVWTEAILQVLPLRDPATLFASEHVTLFAVAEDLSQQLSDAASLSWGQTSEPDAHDRWYDAVEQITTHGMIGELADAAASDDVYQTLHENEMGQLVHEWGFDLLPGDAVTLEMEAFHNGSEAFYVNFSTNRSTWSNLFALPPAGSDQVISHSLPADVSGRVWVRVKDADGGSEDPRQDTVYVDRLALHVDSDTSTPSPDPVPQPPEPVPPSDDLEPDDVEPPDDVPPIGHGFYPVQQHTSNGSSAGLEQLAASDNRYAVLTESTSGSARLFHTWEFEIPPGAAAVVELEAHTNAATEVFWLSYQVGDAFRYLATIDARQDQGEVISAELPAEIGERVVLKLIDADANESDPSQVFVDRLAVLIDGASTPALPRVSVAAVAASVAEHDPQGTSFQVTRTGDLATDLTVQFEVAGSATLDHDYSIATTSPGTFASGVDTISIALVAIDDEAEEPSESVVLRLLAAADYQLAELASASVSIVDDDSVYHEVHPVAERSMRGSRVAGSLAALLTSDEVYEELRESPTPSARLLHIWDFQVPSATTATLSIQGYTESSTDQFWVNVSVGNGSWRNLLTLNSAQDRHRPLTRQIPFELSGPISIRIIDSNSNTDAFADSVFIDELKLILT